LDQRPVAEEFAVRATAVAPHPAPVEAEAAAAERSLLVPSLLAIVIAELALFAWFSLINRDEGWYLYASRLVYDGNIPYRDFNYFQAPVLPYVYGLPQWIFGSSLLVGRLTSVVITIGAVFALARGARLAGGAAAVPWLLGLLAVNVPLLAYCSLARSEAATTLLVSLALVCFLQFRRGLPALLLAPACLLLATGIRSPLLPAFVLATAYVWWRSPASWAERALAAALLAAELALIAAPLLLGHDHVVFNLWSSQTGRSSQWSPVGAGDPARLTARLDQIGSSWIRFLALSVPLALLLAYAVGVAREGWRPRWRDPFSDTMTMAALLVGLGVLLVAPFLAAKPFEARYVVPSSALGCVVVAMVASRASAIPGDVAFKTLFATVVVLAAVLGLPFFAGEAQSMLVPRGPAQQERDAGAIIRSYMGPDDRLLAFDTTLAIDSGRTLMPGLEMDMFSYWPHMSDADAESKRTWTESRLLGAIGSAQPKVIALTAFDLTSGVGPTLHQPPANTPFVPLPLNVLPQIAAHYTVKNVIPDFGQFKDNLYILVRTH
jgi:hypothetical protein